MNITLSVDERIAEQARAAASTMGKSLNQAVRDYLEQLAGQQQLASDNYADLCPEALAALETNRWSGLTAFQRWSVGTRTGS